jgi:hypothetical protein
MDTNQTNNQTDDNNTTNTDDTFDANAAYVESEEADLGAVALDNAGVEEPTQELPEVEDLPAQTSSEKENVIEEQVAQFQEQLNNGEEGAVQIADEPPKQ